MENIKIINTWLMSFSKVNLDQELIMKVLPHKRKKTNVKMVMILNPMKITTLDPMNPRTLNPKRMNQTKRISTRNMNRILKSSTVLKTLNRLNLTKSY